MNKVTNPHDRFFRAAMSECHVAQDFFEQHLPIKIKNAIDLNTLKPHKRSFVDETLRLSVSDVLYSVNMKDEEAYLYLLAEHQSTPQKLMPFRIYKYMWAIMDMHLQKTKIGLTQSSKVEAKNIFDERV